MRKTRREILSLAGPSILANLTVPLVGLVDTAISGHLGSLSESEGFSGAALIGGIAIGTMLFNLLYWNFSFLRTGTGGVTAQAYGEECSGKGGGNGRKTASILLRSLTIAILSGIALIALQWVFIQAAFFFVKTGEDVRLLATRYFYIRIWAAPATLSLFALKGWFIGMQDTVRPMLTDIIVTAVNIAGSIFLAFGKPALGFDGIALGTVIAQWTGLAAALVLLANGYGKTALREIRWQDLKTLFSDRKETARFFSLNRDLFFRSLGMIAVYIGFTTISARFGDLLLSVGTILMQLLMVFSYFTDGFAYAGEALTGKYIGMGDREGLRSSIRGVFCWSMGIAVGFLFVYAAAGVPMLQLMTSDEAVVAEGTKYLPWLLVMPLLGCPAFTWDGIYAGAVRTRDMMLSVVLSALGFFLFWALGIHFFGARVPSGLTAGEWALHILLAAYFIHLLIRTAYLSARAGKSTCPVTGRLA